MKTIFKFLTFLMYFLKFLSCLVEYIIDSPSLNNGSPYTLYFDVWEYLFYYNGS